MELSIFEVLGPVMIGPSSSHTAGAARLARVAAIIANKPFHKVEFALSGSFAKTGRGHGTHKALLAGALGFAVDDERIRHADAYARKQGVEALYREEDLEDMHENTVHFSFFHDDGTRAEVWGCSLGGGRICIRRIGDFETNFEASSPTLVVRHWDRPGVISDISGLLTKYDINLALMRLSRMARGQEACTTLIGDESFPPEVVEAVRAQNHVLEVIMIDVP